MTLRPPPGFLMNITKHKIKRGKNEVLSSFVILILPQIQLFFKSCLSLSKSVKQKSGVKQWILSFRTIYRFFRTTQSF